MASTRLVVDTGIFIEFLRATNKEKTTLYELSEDTEILISSITLYELLMGAKDEQKKQDVDFLTDSLVVLPFDRTVAQKAGDIYQTLRKSNQMIEFRDIFIGATALVNNLPIKTNNTKHFSRIAELQII